MQVDIPARTDVLQLATDWCRQMASVDRGGFARILAPDGAVHGLAPTGGALRGPAAVEEYFARLKMLCLPKSCEVRSAIVQGDRAMVRWVMRFEAGRGACDRDETYVDGMSMMVMSGQMIVEVWNNYGRMSILRLRV